MLFHQLPITAFNLTARQHWANCFCMRDTLLGLTMTTWEVFSYLSSSSGVFASVAGGMALS